jgi:Flp pilus assembly protein TadG
VVRTQSEQGSALIWFVFLVALLTLVVLTLAAAISQYILARELTDFTEQFALAVKTKLQLSPGMNISTLASSLLTEVANKFNFAELKLAHLSLEAGQTVKVSFCARWDSPITSFSASRTICELALAR